MRAGPILTAALALTVVGAPLQSSRAGEGAASSAPAAGLLEGRFEDGALWRVRLPQHWNGTLLLYSHGYSPAVAPPALAPQGLEETLTAQGYALAASSYSQGGWAVAQAVPDQRLLLKTLTARIGPPSTTIAWGDSMGGLITTALVESPQGSVSAGISACGSIAGTPAMMNTALDGAFAFVTLQARDAGIRMVAVDDDRMNSARVVAALADALRSPAGRARVALAGVLGGLPGWSDPAVARPDHNDYETQLAEMAKALAGGLFPPRTDQEQRAGGVFSWNTGVDYRVLLQHSGRFNWVRHFYEAAHLDLDQDLRRLNAAPRISAGAAALDYMRAHYAPHAAPEVPFLSLHTIGDGLTTEVLQQGYADAAAQGPRAANYRAAWVAGAGHCRFLPGEYLAALHTVEARLGTGHWSATPQALNERAAAAGAGAGRFIRHRAAPLLRACWADAGRCAGAPATR